jgi:hypothetical protein
MRWPWSRHEPDRSEAEAVAARLRDLEARTARTERVVRERDPWSSQILDLIHHRQGDPHAR